MLAVTITGPAPTPRRVGLADLVQHALDRVPALFERGGAQQQHELVAADARDHVVAAGPRAQRAPHAVRELDQQAVAGLVAEAVVDRLEVVEVEVAHRQQRAFAPAGLHRGLQHLRKAHPVRQARQFVEVGLALQLLPLLARVRDVGDREHMVAHRAVGVAQSRDRQLQQARLAVALHVVQLAAPDRRQRPAQCSSGLLLVAPGVAFGGAQQRRYGCSSSSRE